MIDDLDRRQYAPATQRNREPILNVLLRVLPPTGTVLEVSSGTGEHAISFAPQLSPRYWLPSDPSPVALASIAAWREKHPAPNLLSPIFLDARDSAWKIASLQEPITAIVNINMIHIAPWTACLGLLAGAQRTLPPQGLLYLYGPFKQKNQHTAPSNAAFDENLRSQNPEWGVRDLDEVVAAAESHNLILQEAIAMPANNLSVIFKLNE